MRRQIALDPAARTTIAALVARIAQPRATQPIARVIEKVAFNTGVHVRDITGRDRTPSCIRPRVAACWLAMELQLGSTTMIGRAIGGRDHSTILHAHRRAAQMRGTDPAFRMLTDRLLTELRREEEH